jgi:hypothetical protein
MLRYRRAGSGHAELLRAGDVLVPATLTENPIATCEQNGGYARCGCCGVGWRCSMRSRPRS